MALEDILSRQDIPPNVKEEISRYITKRKLANEVLMENNYRLELAMKAADMAWWEMDIITGNVTFDKRKAEMLGYPAENFKHYQDFMNLVHSEDQEKAMTAMRNHLKGLDDKYETEYRILTSSNKYKWFYDIGSIVKRNSNGLPLFARGLVLDITERKESEFIIKSQNKQLKELNATKDKFFSIIAHDLRSPFSLLFGYTELLDENINRFTLEELKNISRSLNETSKNVFILLENLLEWAQMQKGAMIFSPVELLLPELVKNCIAPMEKRIIQKGISIINTISDPIKINADEKMINSVLRNLLSNAVKFTKQKGNIVISARNRDNKTIEISIADNGIGMPEAIKNKLFNIEEKVGRTGTDGEESSGLGLVLCKEFIEKHGGEIWVESKEGIGSIFYFTVSRID